MFSVINTCLYHIINRACLSILTVCPYIIYDNNYKKNQHLTIKRSMASSALYSQGYVIRNYLVQKNGFDENLCKYTYLIPCIISLSKLTNVLNLDGLIVCWLLLSNLSLVVKPYSHLGCKTLQSSWL
jgi:hypothetical protein